MSDEMVTMLVYYYYFFYLQFLGIFQIDLMLRVWKSSKTRTSMLKGYSSLLGYVIWKEWFKNILFLVKNVTFNGADYHIDDFIIENETIAAKISKIYISTEKDMVLICFDLYNIAFDENLAAYKVEEYRGNELDFVINFTNFPSSCHDVCGNIFIKKRI